MRFFLIFCVCLIFAMGLLMIFSTASADFLDHDLDKSPHQVIIKQLCYALVGMLLTWGVQRCGYRRILCWSTPLLWLFIFCLVLVLMPGIGKEVNGSRRWLALAGMSFQPSEFVKYVAPAHFIKCCINSQELRLQGWSLWLFLKWLSLPAVAIGLILIEPNNGTAGVVTLVLLALCLLMGIPLKYWGWPLALACMIAAVSAYHLPYVTARLDVYLHPESDLQGRGHQPYQAKIAAGSGGLFGRGPGNSLQKLSYLPEAQNDYIAAIYAEEFGFIGICVLLSLYALVGYAGFYMALNASDQAGFYLAGAIVFLLCFQVFLNFGVVSGALPSTGLNLPFFSQGGSSLMANIIGIGLLFSIGAPAQRLKSSKC